MQISNSIPNNKKHGYEWLSFMYGITCSQEWLDLGLYGWVWYWFLDGLTGTGSVWLALVLIFGCLDWHCIIRSSTDLWMVGLALYGWVYIVLIFGCLDWHYMVGFGIDFCMVGLALYGWISYWFSDGWTGTVWLGLVLIFHGRTGAVWLNFVLIFGWLDWH